MKWKIYVKINNYFLFTFHSVIAYNLDIDILLNIFIFYENNNTKPH